MTIFTVTVTYGNRFHLLKQVIDSALTEGVTKVIVVDNDSEAESREQLKAYEQELGSDKIKVLYLDDNYGSAGGFKRGLEEAYNDKECEYIWLLDDDNEAQKDSLKVLKIFWNDLKQEDKKDKVSLLSFRQDRIVYKEAIISNNPDLVLGKMNSFKGFHIADLPKKVLKVIKRKFGLMSFVENKTIKSGKVSVAPYGGMFFHKTLITNIGYPKVEFYVYGDDLEWSYRITKKQGKIYLLLASEISDIDKSWHIKTNDKLGFLSFIHAEPFRAYYSIRNSIYFEKNNLVDSFFVYKINIYLYKFLFYIFSDKPKYKLLSKAINDGMNNKMGVTDV